MNSWTHVQLDLSQINQCAVPTWAQSSRLGPPYDSWTHVELDLSSISGLQCPTSARSSARPSTYDSWTQLKRDLVPDQSGAQCSRTAWSSQGPRPRARARAGPGTRRGAHRDPRPRARARGDLAPDQSGAQRSRGAWSSRGSSTHDSYASRRHPINRLRNCNVARSPPRPDHPACGGRPSSGPGAWSSIDGAQPRTTAEVLPTWAMGV